MKKQDEKDSSRRKKEKNEKLEKLERLERLEKVEKVDKLELASKLLGQKNEYLKLPKVAKILSEVCESELHNGSYIRKKYISLDKRIPVEIEKVEEWVECGDICFITKHIELSRLREAIDYFYSNERISDNIRIAAEYLLNATHLSLENILEEISKEIKELS